MLAQFVIHARGRQAVGNSLASEMAELREEQLAGDARKRARAKWLYANDAEASFPCGVVHIQDEAVPVLVAIVPDGIAFLAETPQGATVYDVLEVGRIRRHDLTEVDVVDAAGRHLPEPLHESFEPDVEVWIVLRWTRDGEEHGDRFAFRSQWTAWQAARRLREARKG